MSGNKQLIISVGREFGSGGHAIAEALAERFGFELYDYNILQHIAERTGGDAELLKNFEEKPKRMLYRNVRGFSNSPEDALYDMQTKFITAKAEKGESFVIVGRCAETILKDYAALVSIFVMGDHSRKVDRIAERYGLGRADAAAKIKRVDKKRRTYHNNHCDIKWGDSRNYDICINSSYAGLDKTVDILEAFIKSR